ncbi:MarR family winged helix-turn-helix transcriptional regulator [Paenibacillus sp. sgz500958]|uniref:MarR family winged helix-turn-helix transcriptional regulator n=1 Tax=Paenibacillus sp. sgz500958 TaxID=3242475 RepID=UPI0036D3BC81
MDLFEQLIIAIKQLQELTSEVTKPTDPDDIPDSYVYLLFMIVRKGRIKTIEISEYFSLTPGAATAVADKLERMGLISRTRDTKDRRISWIELTDAGMEYVNRRKGEHIEMFGKILKGYTEDELLVTVQTLNRLSESILSYQNGKEEL